MPSGFFPTAGVVKKYTAAPTILMNSPWNLRQKFPQMQSRHAMIWDPLGLCVVPSENIKYVV